VVCSTITSRRVESRSNHLDKNGGVNALSDLTSAAGWKVDGCPSDWKDGETKVTMTCMDASKCAHVFNGGAEDTVVRLPESCGKGPFARVMTCTKMGGKRATSSSTIANGMQWSTTLSFDMSSKPPEYVYWSTLTIFMHN
jgi:hypothetical protein